MSFTATGDWSANATGAAIAADVRFQQLGETGVVPPDVAASVVNGVLKDSDGDTGVALPGPVGGVTVTGSGPFTVTFTGKLGGADQPAMTADGSALTGGTTPSVAVATTTAGGAGVDEVQTVTISGGPTGGTFTLTFNGQTTDPIDYDATAAEIQAALRALSTIGGADPMFYRADFRNVTVDGYTVDPARALFQASESGTVNLAALMPVLGVAVAS